MPFLGVSSQPCPPELRLGRALFAFQGWEGFRAGKFDSCRVGVFLKSIFICRSGILRVSRAIRPLSYLNGEKAGRCIMPHKYDPLDEFVMRSLRSGAYGLATYLLLWQQSFYDGSYILAALAVFLIAMTRQSLPLIQVLLGVLFISTIFSDEIIKAVGALT
jgi:hypothetical protein